MSSWHSYPSIFNIGHRAVADLLKTPVLVEEKVDGSQFSFGLFPIEETSPTYDPQYHISGDTELKVRSKGAVMHPDAPEKMFTEGVEFVKSIQHLLHPGWTYRGEYLKKPRHNALAYDRVPKGHVVIFDVTTGEEEYLDYDQKKAEAERLGLEVVPLLYQGIVTGIDEFRSFLDRVSILGGQKIEGVVIKPVGYGLFGRDKKCLFAKFVSESYKEVHSLSWKADNPSTGAIIDRLGDAYCTAARWQKAIQHLRERGEIEDSPRDIGKLIPEIQADIKREEEEAIKEKLFAYAWPHIRRKVTAGLPEYYKEQLLKLQFERDVVPEQGSTEKVTTDVERMVTPGDASVPVLDQTALTCPHPMDSVR